ncbi:MAG: hypothetical protein ABSH53_13925 [Holophaga sp.]|jgi:site-specific recombinase
MTPSRQFLLNAPGGDQAWFEGLLRWVLEASPRGGGRSRRTARLRALNETLRDAPRRPAWRARIRNVWGHAGAVRLLADTGLPAHTAFLREDWHRLVERFVPSLDPEGDLSETFANLRRGAPTEQGANESKFMEKKWTPMNKN